MSNSSECCLSNIYPGLITPKLLNYLGNCISSPNPKRKIIKAVRRLYGMGVLGKKDELRVEVVGGVTVHTF